MNRTPPLPGEIRKGGEIEGKPASQRSALFIWDACPKCNELRWIINHAKGRTCKRCAIKEHYLRLSDLHKQGKLASRWKGGRTVDTVGYVHVMLQPDDFYYPMADHRGYVLEHRLVMARYLGRCLQDWELVHHKGIRYSGKDNKQDNELDNLELTSGLGEHSTAHSKGYRDGYAKGLTDGRNKQIEELKQEIRFLELRLKQHLELDTLR